MEEDYAYSRTRERLGALLFFAIGTIAYWTIGDAAFQTQLFPRLISVVILLGTAVIFARSFWTAKTASQAKAPSGDGEAETAKVAGPRIALAFVISAAYIFAVPYVGFIVGTSIFMVTSALMFGYRKWLGIAATVVIYVGLVSALLRYGFHIFLPEPLLRL